ncbi:ubiquinone anaerobic biosynthesis accessory factor UbiT [Hydrogenophilus islandicus]
MHNRFFQLFSALLGRVPRYPLTLLFCEALNRHLLPHLDRERLSPLLDQPIRINVSDLSWQFDFTLAPFGFRPYMGIAPRLTFSAPLAVYLALIAQEEDSDTLFFQRRLRISGDTAMGLLIKNTLDALPREVVPSLFFSLYPTLKRWVAT